MLNHRIDRLFLCLIAQLQSSSKYQDCAQKLSAQISESGIRLTSSDRYLIAEAYQIAEDLLENPFFEGLAIELYGADRRLYGIAPARVFLVVN